jgi:cation:H+ antiporter
MLLGLSLVLVSAGVLWVGAELFAEHATGAGRRLGTTGLVVGLLLAGAEPEELITAVVAALRDRGGIAAGDAIGANVTMLTLVVGLAALAGGMPIGGRVRRYLVGASLLGAVAAVLVPGGLGRGEGLFLILLFTGTVGVVWVGERRLPAIGELADVEEETAGKENSEGRLALALVGIGVMAAGGWVAVLGAERVVDALGVADSVVGLTLVALATTAELLALAAAAHRRGVSELAVAGVVGSAGYNSTVTLGGAALARPLVTTGVVAAAWLAAGLPLLLLVLGGRSGRIPRWGGVLLVGVYVAYVAVLYT